MSALTGEPPEALLGHTLDGVLGEDGAERVAHAASHVELEDAALYVSAIDCVLPSKRMRFDLTTHRHDGTLIVEMEAAAASGDAFDSIYPLTRTFARGLQNASTVQELADLAVREVRAIKRFGRVMLYSFDDEGRSHVLAEDRDPDYASFLHQFFPASDILRQARALYLRNRIRLVADVNYTPAPLVPPLNPLTGRPTDLTYATLRSFSPVHFEYMRNMNTHASMSVSIIVRGHLWGLVSYHDHDARFVPFNTQLAVEHLGHMLSLQIEAKEERAEG